MSNKLSLTLFRVFGSQENKCTNKIINTNCVFNAKLFFSTIVSVMPNVYLKDIPGKGGSSPLLLSVSNDL